MDLGYCYICMIPVDEIQKGEYYIRNGVLYIDQEFYDRLNPEFENLKVFENYENNINSIPGI